MEYKTIYTPNQRFKVNIFKTWYIMFRNVYDYRELIFQLFKRDFLMTYKKSFLGIAWILITPLVGIVNWAFLNYTGVLDPGETTIPYPAYVLLSTSIWGLFMGFYVASSNTLNAGAGFIMQVKFPHEALLFKENFQHLVNFTISFVIIITTLMLFGVKFSFLSIFFPLTILPLFFLGSSIGLIVGVINIVAVDIGRVINKLMELLLYVTPVLFASNTENENLQIALKYNPLTYLLGVARDLLIEKNVQNLDIYLIISLVTFLIFLLALRLFYVSEDRVIEKMI
ncbi:MAG: transport permease protein [Candidatus Dojkabacteria bacterium]|nr:MAG: transport permease protein [Candidatus Dojkabacteria bacterium]